MRPSHLGVILAIGLSGCAGNTGQSERTAAACDIALDYAKRFKAEWDELGRPIAVSEKPPFRTPTRDEVGAFLVRKPEFKDDIELAHILARADLGDQSALDRCGGLRGWLRASSIVHNDKRLDELTAHEEWPVTVLAMTLPTLSEDASTAVMYVSEFAGPSAGVSLIVSYTKAPDGQWVQLEKIVLAVS